MRGMQLNLYIYSQALLFDAERQGGIYILGVGVFPYFFISFYKIVSLMDQDNMSCHPYESPSWCDIISI